MSFTATDRLYTYFPDAAKGCFPHFDSQTENICLLTEYNMHEGILLPRDSNVNRSFIDLFEQWLFGREPSVYDYFTYEMANFTFSDLLADEWLYSTWQGNFPGYIAGGSAINIPSNAYHGYDITLSIQEAGVFSTKAFRSSSTVPSRDSVAYVGIEDPLSIVVPTTTEESVTNYLETKSDQDGAMQDFDLTQVSVDNNVNSLNDFNLLIDFITPMLRNCRMSFLPYSFSGSCVQTVYDTSTRQVSKFKFDASKSLDENQIPIGSNTPDGPASSQSQVALPGAGKIQLTQLNSDGSTEKLKEQGCSMKLSDYDKVWNGMQSLMEYLRYLKSNLMNNKYTQFFVTDYPQSSKYETKKEAVVCLIGLMEGMIDRGGNWSGFHNWRTFTPSGVMQPYCQGFLNLPDTSDKYRMTWFLDQYVPFTKDDSTKLALDPGKSIMGALVMLLYRLQYEIQAQVGLAATDNMMNLAGQLDKNSSSKGILLSPGYPTLPFLSYRSSSQSASCFYAPMSDYEDKFKTASLKLSDSEAMNQELKIDIVNKVTGVDNAPPVVTEALYLPKPNKFTVYDIDVPSSSQHLFVKNGKVFRYARYSPNFEGMVTASTTQRSVSFLNEAFADMLGTNQQKAELALKEMIKDFEKAKARDAIQRAYVAYHMENIIKFSVMQAEIKSAVERAQSSASSTTSGSSVTPMPKQGGNYCRFTLSDHERLQSVWRLAPASTALNSALGLDGDQSSATAYQDMLDQSETADLYRDMAYNLAWKIVSNHLSSKLKEHQVAFYAAMQGLKGSPTIQTLSEQGELNAQKYTNHYNRGSGSTPSVAEGGDPAAAAAEANPAVPPEIENLVRFPASTVCPNVDVTVYTDHQDSFIR